MTSRKLKSVDDVILHWLNGRMMRRAALTVEVVNLCIHRKIPIPSKRRSDTAERAVGQHIDALLDSGKVKELVVRHNATRLQAWYVLGSTTLHQFGSEKFGHDTARV